MLSARLAVAMLMLRCSSALLRRVITALRMLKMPLRIQLILSRGSAAALTLLKWHSLGC